MKTELKLVKYDEETDSNALIEVKPDGTEPPKTNWLAGLKQGCVFVCRMVNSTEIALPQYHVVRQFKKCTCLYTNLNEERNAIVHTETFSKNFELIEILREQEE